MEINNNKLKAKNWFEGDTFALKIESKDPKYNGRYFILIKIDYPEWEKSTDCPAFRVKITKNDYLPILKEDIEKLEYIKTFFYHFSQRYFGVVKGIKNYKMLKDEHKGNKCYPDEYGYLYSYHFVLFADCRKKYSKLTYLGNFDIKEPFEEYHLQDKFVRVPTRKFEDIQKCLIESYESYNLKKDKIYDSKYRKELLKIIKQDVKMQIKIQNEMYERFRKEKNN